MKNQVNPYVTLSALCDALNQNTEDVLSVLGIRDMSFLPIYGGQEPTKTKGIWSWNDTHLMVGDSVPFEIVERGEYFRQEED